MMTRLLTFSLAALASLVLWSGSALADTADANVSGSDPAAVVEATARRALDVLEERREEFSEDADALFTAIDEILLPVFDVQRSGDLVLGRHARSASADQRRRFAQALYRALVRQYADNALDFSPDQLVIRPVRGEVDPRRTRVDSEVRLSDGTRVAIAYMLRETEEGWKVFDVVAEGISFVRNFREQYDAEIRRRGLDDVIASLERQGGIAAPDEDGAG
ncbi:MAG: ABC transporter substrate-binding protein [Gammaproteobacteria bacterium]|nr:ABC transporter substrate-binding protein [Gammaproteobacteria bacterium]